MNNETSTNYLLLYIIVNFSLLDSWFALAIVYKLLEISTLKNLIIIIIIIKYHKSKSLHCNLSKNSHAVFSTTVDYQILHKYFEINSVLKIKSNKEN